MAHRRLALSAFCALVGLSFGTTASANAGPVLGLWRTERAAALVEVVHCGASLCGTIIALAQEADGKVILTDKRNHDPALRGRRIKGLMILSGLRQDGDRWIGGTIYSPERGRAFASKVSLQANGTLKVEGCVAQFCQAQIWSRAPAPQPAPAAAP